MKPPVTNDIKSLKEKVYVVQIDGSSRYNPGPAGIGIRIVAPDGSITKEISRFIGIKTNNQAEYEAVLVALQELHMQHHLRPAVIQTDSQLLYYQLMGKYRVRNKNLKDSHQRALSLLNTMPDVKLSLIPREQNSAPDRLAKSASNIGKKIAGDEIPKS